MKFDRKPDFFLILLKKSIMCVCVWRSHKYPSDQNIEYRIYLCEKVKWEWKVEKVAQSKENESKKITEKSRKITNEYNTRRSYVFFTTISYMSECVERFDRCHKCLKLLSIHSYTATYSYIHIAIYTHVRYTDVIVNRWKLSTHCSRALSF